MAAKIHTLTRRQETTLKRTYMRIYRNSFLREEKRTIFMNIRVLLGGSHCFENRGRPKKGGNLFAAFLRFVHPVSLLTQKKYHI